MSFKVYKLKHILQLSACVFKKYSDSCCLNETVDSAVTIISGKAFQSFTVLGKSEYTVFIVICTY